MIGISIVSVIVLLGILIFVHELGHFWVAKRSGVGVLKFSLGFGPKLLGKKIGETEYLLSLIPLGGYVKLLGEAPGEDLSEEDARRSFLAQPVLKRIGIVAAGPAFNLLLAVLVFTVVNMIGLPVLTSAIGGLQSGSAAEEAGLRTGDRIVALDGRAVEKWDEISEIIGRSGGEPIRVRFIRESLPGEITVVPRLVQTTNLFGEKVDGYKIGISPSPDTVIERHYPWTALGMGVRQTWTVGKLTILSIVKMFQGIVSPKNLGGPILIAQIAGAQVREGFVPFVLFMALLSVNLAILNLLPIPVLDGGHLLFYAVELATGREINIRWREMAQQVGFVLLILLMIFVFMLDIDRLNIGIINDFIRIFTD